MVQTEERYVTTVLGIVSIMIRTVLSRVYSRVLAGCRRVGQ